MSICMIPECGEQMYGRGWCSKHYARWFKHGDPTVVKDNKGARNTVDTFWTKVDVRGKDECWEWKAARDKGGYGIFHFMKTIKAHRFVMQHILEIDIAGLVVCHRCDNSSCVNPDHLFIGTEADNMRDRDLKLRQARGVKIHKAKFTAEEVRHLRYLYDSGVSVKELSVKFNLQLANMRNIVTRKSYKDVE